MNKIYRIVNKANGRTYIGFTMNTLERRWYHHLVLLRKNKHTCKTMQKDFLLFGEENFYIELVENVYKREESKELEDYWISIKDDNFHAFYNRKENGEFRKSALPVNGFWKGQVLND